MTTEPIPWWEPRLGSPVQKAVLGVLDEEYINDGPVTRALEQRLAEIAGVQYAVATPSCTVAIAISLMAAGIGHGDEVIVPDFTFIATANAARLAGADVKLVDIEPERFTIEPDRVAEAISPRTKAVIAVDLNGRAARYPELTAICQENGLTLICDSAQALGFRSNGKGLGSFGATGCFSFSAHKMFFGGQGGGAVTDDEALYLRLRDLRDHGRRERGPRFNVGHEGLGFNFKYPSLLAAVVLAQLEELDARMAHVNQRDRWYRELLDGCNGLSFPGDPTDPDEACLWADVMVEDQGALIDRFEAAGIGYRRFWLPLHMHKHYKQLDVAFPNAIDAWEKGLWLPSGISLTREQAERVALICRDA